MQHAAERYHITVADSEVFANLLANPPESIRRQFMDSLGEFHADAYRVAMTAPKNDSMVHALVVVPARLQTLYRRIQDSMEAEVTITDSELLQRYYDETTSADVEYVDIRPGGSVAAVEACVADSELLSYYIAHTSKYRAEEKRSIRVVALQDRLSMADSIAFEEKLNRIEDTLRSLPPARVEAGAMEMTSWQSEADPKDAVGYEYYWEVGDLVFGGKLTVKRADLISQRNGETFRAEDRNRALVCRVIATKPNGKDYLVTRQVRIERNALISDDSQMSLSKEVYQNVCDGDDSAMIRKKHPFLKIHDEAKGCKLSAIPGELRGLTNARIGAILKPICDKDGCSIIQVLDRKRDRDVRLAAVLVDKRPSMELLSNMTSQAEHLRQRAGVIGFEQAAYALDLKAPHDLPACDRHHFSFDDRTGFVDWVFGASVGDVCKPILYSWNSAMVAQVKEIVPAGQEPLSQVEGLVRRSVAYAKLDSLLAPKARTAYQLLATGKANLGHVGRLLKDSAMKPVKTVLSPQHDYATEERSFGFGHDSTTNGLFELQPGSVLPPVPLYRDEFDYAVGGVVRKFEGYRIYRLIDKKIASQDGFAERKPALREAALERKRRDYLRDRIVEMENNAHVEVFGRYY